MKQPPFFRSLRHAVDGICYAVRSQRNARRQLVIGAIAVIFGVVVGLDATRWAILVLAMGAVLATEVMNTAVEAAVDLCTTEVHPLARHAKDAAAGAVLCASLTAILVGLCLFGPWLWQQLSQFT